MRRFNSITPLTRLRDKIDISFDLIGSLAKSIGDLVLFPHTDYNLILCADRLIKFGIMNMRCNREIDESFRNNKQYFEI